MKDKTQELRDIQQQVEQFRDEHALSLTRPGKNLFNSIESVLNQCESLIDRISTSGIEDAHLSRIIKTIQTCIRHTNETLQDEDEADTLEDLVEGKKYVDSISQWVESIHEMKKSATDELAPHSSVASRK